MSPKINMNQFTKNQLIALAKEQGRRGYSRLNKSQLYELVNSPVIVFVDENGNEITNKDRRREKTNEYLKTKTACKICTKMISRRNLSRHLKIHDKDNDLKKLDDDLFGKLNGSLPSFKIRKAQSKYIKKFNAYSDDYSVDVRKELSIYDIYLVFQQLISQSIKHNKLQDNDKLNMVIKHSSLDHPISSG